MHGGRSAELIRRTPFWCPMSNERINTDYSKRLPTGRPSLMAGVLSLSLPFVVGLLSNVALRLWLILYYWRRDFFGVEEHGTRTHTVTYNTIATPLFFSSAALFLIVAYYSFWIAKRRGALAQVGTVISILVGALLLTMASFGARLN